MASIEHLSIFSIFSAMFTLTLLKNKWMSHIDAQQKARLGLNISSSPILGFCHTSTQHHFTPRNSTLIPLSSAHISDGSADSSQEFCWCLIECNLSYCTRDISWLWLCSNKCLCLCLRKGIIFLRGKVKCLICTLSSPLPEQILLE